MSLIALRDKIKATKRVAVIWADAWYSSEESSLEEHKHEPWYYCAEGYLMKSNDEGVSLAQEIGQDGQFRGRSFILRSLILQEWEIPPLKIPKKPKSNESSSPPSSLHS